MTTRCGVVAIVGEPNAGKSTLINQLVGGKVSIVTPKAQTTRFNIRGVCIEGTSQLIFVDTPGIFDAGRKFEKAMVAAAWSGIGDADAVLMILDAKRGLNDSAQGIIEQLKKITKPVCIALNKIDLIDKETLIKLAQHCDGFRLFEKIFMIAAKQGDGVEDIKAFLAEKMPEGPFLYPEDQMSDISLRLLAAEITREKLFMKLEQELPYAAFVETEQWQEEGEFVKIHQIILVERETQKKIVIGNKGEMIKQIGMASRKELEQLLGKKIHLQLFVKVKPDWREHRDSYTLLGLEYKK